MAWGDHCHAERYPDYRVGGKPPPEHSVPGSLIAPLHQDTVVQHIEGSSAAVLRGLNQLWNMGRSRQELAALAAALGSDVPLFLGPPAVRMTGCGERIEPVEVWPFWAVLLLPALPVATAEVYRQFDRRPAPAARQVEASLLGRPPSTWRGAMVNHLREPAERVCPQLAAWREKLTRLSLPVCLSGSGSSMFVLCDDRAEAHSVLGRLPPDVRKSCLVVRLNPW